MNVQSVDRAIQILFVFSEEEPVLGLTEISKKLGINQSTVHHLIQSLICNGLIEQEPVTKKYRLGLRTIELGGRMLRSRNLSKVVQPYLHHIADSVGETTFLGVLENGDLLNLEQVCCSHLIQNCGWQGRRTPFYCTSAGKVLASYLSDEELHSLIEQKQLTKYTQRTIIDPEMLLQELALVREQGYGYNLGELEEPNNAVAVPIFGPGRSQVIASLGVVGPAYRFSKEKCLGAVPILKSTATDISSLIRNGGSW